MSILSELYHGDIYPAEQIIPDHSHYHRINTEILEQMLQLETDLTKKDFKRLEALRDLLCQSSSMENEHSFIHGFTLGILFMTESLTVHKELSADESV